MSASGYSDQGKAMRTPARAPASASHSTPAPTPPQHGAERQRAARLRRLAGRRPASASSADQQHQVPVALGVAEEFVGAAHVHVQALGPQHLGRQAQRLDQAGPGQRIRLAGIQQQDAQRRFLGEAGQFSVRHGMHARDGSRSLPG
jgi:hypothetical protein